jgi:hypothetical protein
LIKPSYLFIENSVLGVKQLIGKFVQLDFQKDSLFGQLRN